MKNPWCIMDSLHKNMATKKGGWSQTSSGLKLLRFFKHHGGEQRRESMKRIGAYIWQCFHVFACMNDHVFFWNTSLRVRSCDSLCINWSVTCLHSKAVINLVHCINTYRIIRPCTHAHPSNTSVTHPSNTSVIGFAKQYGTQNAMCFPH